MYDSVMTQDELEAKDKKIEELETIVNNLKDRVLTPSNHEKMPNTTCFLPD